MHDNESEQADENSLFRSWRAALRDSRKYAEVETRRTMPRSWVSCTKRCRAMSILAGPHANSPPRAYRSSS